MNNLQSTLVTNPKSLDVIILCPGLNKGDITISFEKKNGVLDIVGAPPENLKLAKHIDMEIKGSIVIDPKYRSKKIDASIENGILTVKLGLSDDVGVVEVS